MDCIIDIVGILDLLPHRFPFLLVDKVKSLEPYRSIECLKNVTYNEPFFVGHFPKMPVLPGVLQLEMMAQASAICHIESMRRDGIDTSEKLFMFTNVKNAKFAKPVKPGDSVIISSTVIRSGSRFAGYACKCHVEGVLVSEAEIYASTVEIKK